MDQKSETHLLPEDLTVHESTQLNVLERRLVHLLSADLNLSLQPYADWAEELNISEAEVISTIEGLFAKGLIRRFGAIVAHQKSGFAANAMVVLLLDEARLDQVGESLAQLPYVSHCYRRRPISDWPYNLYAMIHAESPTQLLEMTQKIVVLSGATEWRALESVTEFKKESLILSI
jgi:DNA-binding Lrp family transcriptional regulator